MRRVAVAVALLVCVPRPAGAGPIDPFGFASLGAFDSSGLPGTYTISGTTLTRPDGTTLAGVSYQDNPGHSLTVFDFSSFNLTAGSSIFAGGTAPLVLLAQSSMTIAGRISLPASSLFSFNSTPGSEATNAREGLGHIDS